MRRVPRCLHSAALELIYSGSMELVRVSEISKYGCYLETPTTLAPGTTVPVRIMDGGELFEATATMLYSRPAGGAGVAFRNVKSAFQIILEEWLRRLGEHPHNAI